MINQKTVLLNFKSSHSQMFFKICVLKIFAVFAEKHLSWSYFSIKVTGLEVCNLLKRDSNTGVFCGYCKNFKNTYFEEYLRTAASVLLMIKLVLSIGHLFIIKNITWDDFYYEGLWIWSEYILY